MKIFSNYISNELITVDDKDPPWMNESIKKKIIHDRVQLAINKNFLVTKTLTYWKNDSCFWFLRKGKKEIKAFC